MRKYPSTIYTSLSPKQWGGGSEKTRGNKFLSIKKKIVHRFQYASVVGEGTMLSRQCIDHRWRRRCLAEKTPATPHAVPEACAILLHLQLFFLEEAEGQGAQVTAPALQSSFQPFYCKSHIYIYIYRHGNSLSFLTPFLSSSLHIHQAVFLGNLWPLLVTSQTATTFPATVYPAAVRPRQSVFVEPTNLPDLKVPPQVSLTRTYCLFSDFL